jgi:Na+/proline symporter
MGTMLYATSIIVKAALGLDERQRIVTMIILGAVTTVYTTVGGFKATVWTNVIKSAVLASVIVIVLLLAVTRVDGGWVQVWNIGQANDRFDMFKMKLDLTENANFFSACAFGMFVYLAVAVAGQTAVQRYVSMATVSSARRSLAVNGIGTAVVCLLFFFLGTTMFAFYTQHPEGGAEEGVFPPIKPDEITIHFVKFELPYVGLLGLLLGALYTTVMGSVSSGLNSLAALVVTDFFPGRKLGVSLSRRLCALFGVLTLAAALLVPYLGPHVFHIIVRLSGALFGPLLGVFLLGAAFKRANAQGAAIGLLAGIASLAVIFPTDISFFWYGAFTCIPTLLVGMAASLAFPPPDEKHVRGLVIGSTPSESA